MKTLKEIFAENNEAFYTLSALCSNAEAVKEAGGDANAIVSIIPVDDKETELKRLKRNCAQCAENGGSVDDIIRIIYKAYEEEKAFGFELYIRSGRLHEDTEKE